MSLKAKLEAVIYAAEEPVTLTQLATLFAGDALEWKAAQNAAAAESAESAAEDAAHPLLAAGLEYLGLEETPAISETETDAAENVPPPTESESAISAEISTPDSAPQAIAPTGDDQPPATDTEAETKRLARLREREIKAVLKQLLDELIADYASDARGVEIREIAGGYRMATKPECHDAVRLFVKSLKPPMKLSLPALETLAVVAYKQPVTSPEVSEIRGVESGGVLGSLLARKLIATAGRKPVIGRPILYKTTKEFLLRFGLKDLAELPSMEEFEKMAAAEIEELEPEAVAADDAQLAAELDENPLNGQNGQDNAEAMEAEPPAPHHEPETAPVEPAAIEPAPETSPVTDLLPAQPHQEIEAAPDAEEVQQEI